jgi:hypothetical protein
MLFAATPWGEGWFKMSSLRAFGVNRYHPGPLPDERRRMLNSVLRGRDAAFVVIRAGLRAYVVRAARAAIAGAGFKAAFRYSAGAERSPLPAALELLSGTSAQPEYRCSSER